MIAEAELLEKRRTTYEHIQRLRVLFKILGGLPRPLLKHEHFLKCRLLAIDRKIRDDHKRTRERLRNAHSRDIISSLGRKPITSEINCTLAGGGLDMDLGFVPFSDMDITPEPDRWWRFS